MRAGPRKHRVVIQSNTPIKASDGTPLEGWSDFAIRFASRDDGAGAERVGQTGEVAVQATRLRLPYLANVNTTMRVLLDGVAWDVVSVSEVGFRKGTDLFVELRSR